MSGIIGGAGSRSGAIGTTELDYEEGTWTAVQDSGGSIASNTSIMTYTKIGKLVILQGQFQQGTGQTTSGALTLINLPFANIASPTNGDSRAIGSIRLHNQSLTTSPSGGIAPFFCMLTPGATTLGFHGIRDNDSGVNILRDDAAYMAITITYRTT
tara:strand:- start:712 stop:1179 length:468 start_codon:yes stop_codon:yes gene_type:complete